MALDDEGTLTISGTGEMETAPWRNSETRRIIVYVVIENGVTSIREEAFRECPLTNIDIPDSVTSIGRCAFYGSGLTLAT